MYVRNVFTHSVSFPRNIQLPVTKCNKWFLLHSTLNKKLEDNANYVWLCSSSKYYFNHPLLLHPQTCPSTPLSDMS